MSDRSLRYNTQEKPGKVFISKHKTFSAIFFFLLLTIILINPVREMALQDDWSYARMVERLLETGEYKLDDWAWANMPFQIYWAAFLSKIFGYSFSTLRISTILLALLGCVAFYVLARQQKFDNATSNFLLLVLISSPLFLLFTLTFMTDLPFLGCTLAALALYGTAMEKRNYKLMLVASVAATAATLTRQVGMAFIPALMLIWFFHEKPRPSWSLYLTGMILPAIAALWQFGYTYLHPNWCWKVRSHEQIAYWNHGIALVPHLLWRMSVILQYLAFFCLPFVLLSVWNLIKIILRTEKVSRQQMFIIAVVSLLVLGPYVYNGLNSDRWLMPYLPWNLDGLKGRWASYPITIAVLFGGIAFGTLFVRRYIDSPGWTNLSAVEKLVDLVTLFLLIQHLLFFSFGDEYLLVFLPYSILALGRLFEHQWRRFATVMVLACLALFCASAIWTRGVIAQEEAYWKAAEVPRTKGVPVSEIWGSFSWIGYHRFRDYVQEVEGRDLRNLNDFFSRWLPEQKQRARYLPAGRHLKGTNIVGEVYWRDMYLRPVRLFVLDSRPES